MATFLLEQSLGSEMYDDIATFQRQLDSCYGHETLDDMCTHFGDLALKVAILHPDQNRASHLRQLRQTAYAREPKTLTGLLEFRNELSQAIQTLSSSTTEMGGDFLE